MNFVESKLPSITKSFIDKSLNKFVKKSYGISFFKLADFLKKSMASVKITQL
jgi:hypothetical protein